MLDLHGQAALVTGGAAPGGVGRATACLLARQGAAVAIADVDQAAMDEAVAEIRSMGGVATGYACDVSDEKQVEDLFSGILSAFGRLDILVTAAAVSADAPIETLLEDDLARAMNVNLKGVFLCGRAAIPIMKKQRYGRMVAVSSVFGKQGWWECPIAYSSTKSAILGFVKNLAREVAPYGITANSVCPGLLEKYAPSDEAALKRALRPVPVGRFARAEEIAAAVLFLSSPESSYITGEEIDVNGGYLMD